MVRRVLRRFGVIKATVAFTAIATLSSVGLYLILSLFLGRFVFIGIVMSIIIPGTVTPFLSYFFVRISIQLDESEQNLKKAGEELERRVAKRTGELALTNKRPESEIEERKRAEQELWESETKYRSILENIEDGYYEVDTAGNLIFFNESMCRILGYPDDELIRMNNREFMDRENAGKVFKTFNRVYTTGKPDKGSDWEFTRKDGTKRHVEASVSPIKDEEGRHKGFRGILRDITERKQAEGALRESEKKYRSIFDSAGEGIVVIQGDRVNFINQRMLEIIGYTPKDLNQIAEQSFLSFIHPEDQKIVADRYYRRLKGERLPSTYSVRFIGKDGAPVWVDISPNIISWEGRQSTLAFITDITEKKKLEAQLQRALKMEAIGTLAGGVAHDLNNILSGLVSYPELLLIDMPESSAYRKPIETIKKSGEKAASIVQDLLTLARRGVAVSEVANFNVIVSEYLISPEYKKLKFHHPEINLKTNLEKNLLNILGSPVHLSKTVMNLVSNAAEAMPDGGKIFVSTENQYIERPIRGYDRVKKGDYITLTVSDTGIGISSKDMEKIYEPFYTKKVMGRSGTGLGMAVVWGTVKDHNGYIDVESTEGKGTTFTLYFPVTREELAGKKSKLAIGDYMGDGESILVVDDVEEQRAIASGMLNKLGYSVTSVSSGEETVDYLKDNSADLVLLDMIMDPGIDGLDTYKQILKLHPEQKTIIASGFSETGRVKEAQRLGAGQYIKKPYTLEKIGLAVKGKLGV